MEGMVADWEPCPHCGELPLDVIDGSAECPNCGSLFDEDPKRMVMIQRGDSRFLYLLR